MLKLERISDPIAHNSNSPDLFLSTRECLSEPGKNFITMLNSYQQLNNHLQKRQFCFANSTMIP